jgi:Restriction endonuclease
MRIEKTDPRWFLAQEAAQDLSPSGLLPDEMSVAKIGGQLAMFAEVVDVRMRGAPDAFILWRWANSFEPIATFSILWRKPQTWRRVYMSLNDPRIEDLVGKTCLVVRIEPFAKTVFDIFEISPGDFEDSEGLEHYQDEKVLHVGDVVAGKHLVYWNYLNKPGENAAPADKLRASFIKRLHNEVANAIHCIDQNLLRETIPAEAERLIAAGLNLYGEFPYHREVYAHCRKIWEGYSGHVLQPYFEHFKICSDAGSQRLAYQLQGLLSAALFSVERTQCGLIVPSMDGLIDLDLVDLDPGTMGKRAGLFWERIEWFPSPFFRDAVGPGNIPVDPYELFTQCPALKGDLKEAEKHIQQFMSEAYALKSAVIPPGAYHPIDGGGLLAAVRLHEFGHEVAATFVTHDGSFFVLTMMPKDGDWKLHVSRPEKLRGELATALEQNDTLDATSIDSTLSFDPREEERLEAELERVTRPVKVGLALFVSALVRDFWVIEQRETIFSEKRSVRKVAKLHSDRLKSVIVYLPRIRYTRRLTVESAAHLDNRGRRPHEVTEHMRRCANADPQQVALAKALGFHMPEGFTFVRRHRRGEGEVEKRYRSISALSLLAATGQTGPNASFRDNWLEFERNTRNWLEVSGWAIEQWSASRRGDHGIDIVVSKEDRIAIVQCKFWDPARTVGPNVVRDLIGTRISVGKIVEALLVTSSRLTEGAAKLAKETGVKFVESVDFTRAGSLQKYD